ncbi:MAG: hypothetical protein NT099_09520 [Candidatus Saganbacteria bacterium]|nr:hypothetical protein [Candidatus Saganbacteria bacterium]
MQTLYNIIFLPPVAFFIVMAATLLLAWILSPLAYKPKNPPKDGTKAYACGENVPKHRIQINYTQFFPFAFFFTILHMAALMVTTVPTSNLATFFIAFIYILGALVGLLILLNRREIGHGSD